MGQLSAFLPLLGPTRTRAHVRPTRARALLSLPACLPLPGPTNQPAQLPSLSDDVAPPVILLSHADRRAMVVVDG
jgi:hypothetical protein